MKSINQSLTLALLATLATHANAADDPVLNLITPDSRLSLGVGYLSGEREQFGIYDDVNGNQKLVLFDGDIITRDDATGTWMTLSARNLGIANRAVELGYERQGNWGVDFDYSRIPYKAPYTVISGMTGLGSETQTVPGGTYVPGTGRFVNLGTDRDRTGLEFFKYLGPEIKIRVGFRDEEKTGDRHWGRGGQAEFAAEPIDSTNQIFDATLDYMGKSLQLTGGYTGNWYQNHNSLVQTSSPSNSYYLSLPLDSEAHQFFMNGGFSFTPTTRATFRMSYTEATVDEHIPTADIPGLAWDGITIEDPSPGYPAAPSKLDAGLETTVLFLGLSSRPMDNLSLVANVRYYEVDETTDPDLIVCRNCGDANPANNSLVHQTPLDYETVSGKVEATYRLPQGFSLIAGVDLKNQDRTTPFGSDQDDDGIDEERYVPFRADLDETTYQIQLRKSMSDTVNGSLSLSQSERDGSNFTEAIHSEPGEGIEPEAINPINIADRDRTKLRATLDWAPLYELNVQFNYQTAQDEYSGHSLGLNKGEADIISVDLSYAVSDNVQLTAWASRDTTKAKQENHRFASGSYAEAEMFDSLRDVGDSAGIGLDCTVNEKLTIGADLEWTRTDSEYNQFLETSGPGTLYENGTTGPLPNIVSTAAKVELFAEYALADNAGVRFDLVHEYWDTDDWTWEFSNGTPFIYGSPNDGTMIIMDPHQSSTFVGVRYYYDF